MLNDKFVCSCLIYQAMSFLRRDCVIIDVVAQFIGLLMVLSTSLINEATTIVAKNGVVTQSGKQESSSCLEF